MFGVAQIFKDLLISLSFRLSAKPIGVHLPSVGAIRPAPFESPRAEMQQGY